MHRPPASIPRERRKGFYYFAAFFALAGVALQLVFFGPTRPLWLPSVPLGVGLLLLIVAAIVEWRHPV